MLVVVDRIARLDSTHYLFCCVSLAAVLYDGNSQGIRAVFSEGCSVPDVPWRRRSHGQCSGRHSSAVRRHVDQ